MNLPFDYVNGKPIDLNNDEHRKVVIQRNKKLDKFSKESSELGEMNPLINIDITIQCLKCGGDMTSDNDLDGDDLDKYIGEIFDCLKCDTCKSTYERKSCFSEEWIFNPSKKII